MQVQVEEWGNRQGNRVPQEASNDVITLVKSFRHKTLEERAAEFEGKLMLDGEYDWEEPVGREMW